MKKLEREALEGDRELVQSVLGEMHAGDVLGRLSFESRLREIQQRLAELAGDQSSLGSVALIFEGNPVHGSRSIDASFTARILSIFQDLVTKRVAMEEIGVIGARGPMPMRFETGLAISDVVRGSVGFVLEETAHNESLTDSVLKIAIHEVSTIVQQAGSELAEDFERAAESLDPRLLGALGEFFVELDDSRATVRIVEDDREAAMDAAAIRRGRDRVSSTEISEREDDTVVGRLLGLIPNGRRFELQLASGEIVRGSVAAAVAPQYMDLISDPRRASVGRVWQVKMRIREVRERNRDPRVVYTLLGLLREISEG